MPDHVGEAEGACSREAERGPVSASTSSMVRPCSSMSVTPVNITATPMRLAMKLGVSLAKTTCLPSARSANVANAATSSGSLSSVGMISSNCM